MLIWLNGDLSDDSVNLIPATSAGLTIGWGVFTTLGIYQSRPFLLDRHLARLRESARATNIDLAFDDAAIEAGLQSVVTRNQVINGFARLTLTRRHDGRWSQTPGSDLAIFAAPRTPQPVQGLRIMLSSCRLDARRPLAGIKTTSYLEHQWMWQEAHDLKFDEAVFCNSQGVLCEGTRSNLFWVTGGELRTPAISAGCLPGIARALICNWALELNVTLREGAFALQELAAADEVFLTSSTNGPRAVQTFCESPFDDVAEHKYPGPGSLTQVFQEKWAAATCRDE